MPDDQFALAGRATELFAGIPVRDLPTAIEWYQRLFGKPPSFLPNETEAVWAIGANRWIYIIVAPERAGGAIQTIICDDLETLIEEIAGRGIDYVEEETPAEGVRKVMYNDP